MVTTLIPTNLIGVVAKAAENKNVNIIENDLYLRTAAQYGDKALVTYGIKTEDNKSAIRISLFDKGQEKVIKELVAKDGETAWSIEEKSEEGKAAFSVYNVAENRVKFEYDFKTNELKEVNSEIIDHKGYSESRSEIYDKNVEQNLLNKINEKYNTNYTLAKDYTDGGAHISVKNFKLEHEGKTIEAIEFNCNIRNAGEYGIVEYYSGFIFKDLVLINKHSYIYPNYDENTRKLTIYSKDEGNKAYNYSTISIEGAITNEKIILDKDMRLSNHIIASVNGLTYMRGYIDSEEILVELRKNNDGYHINNSYSMKDGYTNIVVDKNNNLWFLNGSSNKVNVNKIQNGQMTTAYELDTTKINHQFLQLYVYDENNIIVASPMGSIMISSKDNTGNPNEGNNNNQGDNNQGNNNQGSGNGGNNNSGSDNVTIKPIENGQAKVEVATVNPNGENKINLQLDDSAKSVEVTFNDINSIKNGNGSIALNINNTANMNLPFSLIDKSLLDGATSVTVNLNTIVDSEIVKGFNAVNKVYDFTLTINKENGSVNIHNFANGVAEIKINVTDEDLKGLDRNNLSVFYYNEETKKFEEVETIVNGNEITFKTSHFSKYVIGEKSLAEVANNGSSNTQTLPKTGAVVSSTVIALIGLLLVAAGITLNSRRKRKTV
jgi:LPXTG-motif cell wall-anchored protein